MPKSDTWPGGTAMDMRGGMDSAESCDSVVSNNSCHSDDSLQYLSAEEKACLMFLEETIESLDTEDDSGLSNDEAENLPAPGNVATKAAYLSASMDQSKFKDSTKQYVDDPRMFGSSEHNQILNYLVPTPFVLANSNAHIIAKPGTAASKEEMSDKNGPHFPSEVNVVVIPPPVAVKSISERDQGLHSGRSPRGPLTYEGLVQLRMKVSSRKNPEDEKQSSSQQDPFFSNDGAQLFSQNIQPRQKQSSYPPAVAPKPKKMPSHIVVLNNKGSPDPNVESVMHCLSTSPKSIGLMKPEQVRFEALSKLGLLKESDAKPSTKVSPTENHTKSCFQSSSCTFLDMPPNGQCPPSAFVMNQKMSNPTSNSYIFHHCSLTDLTTVPSHASALGKAATLERSGMGLGSSINSDNSARQNHRKSSPTMLPDRYNSNIQMDTTPLSTGKAQASAQSQFTVPTVLNKPLHVSGLNMLKVPNIGEDRREALRKLGLLKT